MLVYIILAVICGLFAVFESGKLQQRDFKMFYVSLMLFLGVVGLRYAHGDYLTYEKGYYMDIDVGGDVGYFYLQQVFHKMGLSFVFFVFVLTLMSVYAFKKTFSISIYPCFGVVMILGKIFTLYAMSGIRQYIAMAICWWAIADLLKNDRIKLFLLTVLVAALIHGSAIVFLLVLFFRNVRFSFVKAIVFLFVAFIIGSFSISLFTESAKYSDFIDTRFGGYVEQKDLEGGMNALNYIENFLFLFLAIVVRKKAMYKIPYYDFFLYMFLVYCGFLIVGNEVAIVKRLRDYFALSYAFIVPGFIYLFDSNILKKTCKVVFVTYFIFLMFRSLQVYDRPFPENTYSRMVPYHCVFNKQK